jgi:hypothetical protein
MMEAAHHNLTDSAFPSPHPTTVSLTFVAGVSNASEVPDLFDRDVLLFAGGKLLITGTILYLHGERDHAMADAKLWFNKPNG